MAGSAKPTEKEVNDLLAEDKVVTANLTWRPWGKGLRLEATVLASTSQVTLKVHGYHGPTYRSFSLLHNSIDIRRVCLSSAARHTNPDGQRFDGLHKHRYDPESGEARYCYLPDDILNPDDTDAAFSDFLKECNISLRGTYERQTNLPHG